MRPNRKRYLINIRGEEMIFLLRQKKKKCVNQMKERKEKALSIYKGPGARRCFSIQETGRRRDKK